jgi:aldehyde dehydrogenase (NAD+)
MVCEAGAKHLTPVSLELGGKSPAIVCPSADLTIAAKRISWGAFLNSGQTCVRPDYVLVHRSVADKFLAEVKKAVVEFYGEDPQKSDFFGRIINVDAHARLTKMVEDVKTTNKSSILLGGCGNADDRYIAPTVLDYGEDEVAFRASPAMSEEIFGPIMPVFRFEELQWAVDFVREGDKPLSVYPFTTEKKEQELILQETSSGGCDVNDVIMRLSNPDLPFGGVGKSGMGEYHGASSFMTFSHRKSVNFKTNYLDLPVRYPPYSTWKRIVLSIVQQVRTANQVKSLKAIVLLALFWLFRRLGVPAKVIISFAVGWRSRNALPQLPF